MAIGTTDPNDPVTPAAYKRDEVAIVQVSSDRALTTGPFLTVAGGDAGVSLRGDTGCCNGVLNCACFNVDLSRPTFRAFRGTLPLQATATGSSGAPSTGGDGGVAVTRWRWSSQAFAPSDVPVAPAVDNKGNVIAGVTSTPTTGSVASIGPTGITHWQIRTGAVTAAIVVSPPDGGGHVHVPMTTDAGSFISTREDLNGGQVGGGCAPVAGTNITVAPTIKVVNGHPQVIGYRAPSGQFFGHRPTDSASPCLNLGLNMIGTHRDSTLITAPPGDFYAHGHTDGRSVTRRDDKSFNTETTRPVGFEPRALAFLENYGIVGSGDQQSSTDGGIFRVDPATGATWSFLTNRVGSISIQLNNLIFFGSTNGTLHRMGFVQVDSTASSVFTAPGFASTSPALGADSNHYAATENGIVFSFASALILNWQEQVPGAIFDTAPTLDCARDGSGVPKVGPGTLYLVGRNTGRIYSFITDSRGLSASAPWPKFQHDNHNTGNPGYVFPCP